MAAFWYPLLLGTLLLLVLLVFLVRSKRRKYFLMESAIVIVALAAFSLTYPLFRFSYLSYSLLSIFLLLHLIGAYYVYEKVPFGEWMKRLFRTKRNHYDRLVHFSFGLLVTYPTYELFVRAAGVQGFWQYWFPVELVAAYSALYEILEWASAEIGKTPDSERFVGMQGDKWDAQKDMLMAILGSIIAVLVLWALNAGGVRTL